MNGGPVNPATTGAINPNTNGSLPQGGAQGGAKISAQTVLLPHGSPLPNASPTTLSPVAKGQAMDLAHLAFAKQFSVPSTGVGLGFMFKGGLKEWLSYENIQPPSIQPNVSQDPSNTLNAQNALASNASSGGRGGRG